MTPTTASIWVKQSIKELILGQRDQAFVFTTIKGILLLFTATSFVTLTLVMLSYLLLQVLPLLNVSYKGGTVPAP